MKTEKIKKLIEEKMEEMGESWSDVVDHTITHEEMNSSVTIVHTAGEYIPFTLWTKNSVYFADVYDGDFRVGRAPRNPCGEKCIFGGG